MTKTERSSALFPKYPCETNLAGATFRGYEHGIVLVANTPPRLGGQPEGLKIQRLVFLMGYSGPSTLGCAIAYLTAPDVFEPQLEKTLLLIVEVPVVCDEAQSDDDEDLRYVPEKSIRIVDRLGNANTDVGQLPIPVDHQKLQCPEGFRNWRRWGATAR